VCAGVRHAATARNERSGSAESKRIPWSAVAYLGGVAPDEEFELESDGDGGGAWSGPLSEGPEALVPLPAGSLPLEAELLAPSLLEGGVVVWAEMSGLPVSSWPRFEAVPPSFTELFSAFFLSVLELGVELWLVSWLCARAPGAASARARTDNAMNLMTPPRGSLWRAREH